MKKILKKHLDKLMFLIGYEPRRQFPQAGVGCGVIFFLVLGPRHIVVLCASRADVVGAGSGISFGGWKELLQVLQLPDGAYITGEDSALREGWEEIPGLFTVIPEDELRNHMQYLFNASISHPKDIYGNKVHDAIFYGIALNSQAEADALCQLPKSQETSAPLRQFHLTWNTQDASDLTGLPTDFHHTHEPDAFRKLVLMLEQGLLRASRINTRLAA